MPVHACSMLAPLRLSNICMPALLGRVGCGEAPRGVVGVGEAPRGVVGVGEAPRGVESGDGDVARRGEHNEDGGVGWPPI